MPFYNLYSLQYVAFHNAER